MMAHGSVRPEEIRRLVDFHQSQGTGDGREVAVLVEVDPVPEIGTTASLVQQFL